MRKLFVLSIATILSSCSLYQSEGRKFLEQQGFEYAGVSAQAYLRDCQEAKPTEGWVKLTETPLARVYVHETDSFEMRVLPNQDNLSDFHCDYQFPSAKDMMEQTSAAIDLTLAEWSKQMN